MGGIGIALAMLGVIACPITSGDTAFRSARLVLADWFKICSSASRARRRRLSGPEELEEPSAPLRPVLGVGAFLGIGNALGKIDYTIIWRTSAGPTRRSP